MNYSRNTIVNMRRIWIWMFIIFGLNLRSDYFRFVLSLEVIAICQLIEWYGMVVCSTWKVTMFLRVAVLVFLFLARIRFPENESISSIVWKRYSGEVFKAICKLEKVDYKLRKAKLDISFLIKCQNENIIPNFLKFRPANKVSFC